MFKYLGYMFEIIDYKYLYNVIIDGEMFRILLWGWNWIRYGMCNFLVILEGC